MIEILNDHMNLTYFQMFQNLNCQQACWSLFLSRLTSPSSTGQGDTQSSWTPSLVGQIIRPRRKKTIMTQ